MALKGQDHNLINALLIGAGFGLVATVLLCGSPSFALVAKDKKEPKRPIRPKSSGGKPGGGGGTKDTRHIEDRVHKLRGASHDIDKKLAEMSKHGSAEGLTKTDSGTNTNLRKFTGPQNEQFAKDILDKVNKGARDYRDWLSRGGGFRGPPKSGGGSDPWWDGAAPGGGDVTAAALAHAFATNTNSNLSGKNPIHHRVTPHQHTAHHNHSRNIHRNQQRHAQHDPVRHYFSTHDVMGVGEKLGVPRQELNRFRHQSIDQTAQDLRNIQHHQRIRAHDLHHPFHPIRDEAAAQRLGISPGDIGGDASGQVSMNNAQYHFNVDPDFVHHTNINDPMTHNIHGGYGLSAPQLDIGNPDDGIPIHAGTPYPKYA